MCLCVCDAATVSLRFCINCSVKNQNGCVIVVGQGLLHINSRDKALTVRAKRIL